MNRKTDEWDLTMRCTWIGTKKESVQQLSRSTLARIGRASPTRVLGRKTRIVVLAFATLLATTVALSSQSFDATSASGSTKSAVMCPAKSLSESITLSQKSYRPSVSVTMTASIRTTSKSACDVTVGPTSPSLTLTSWRGLQVWNNCYVDDHAGSCALFLALHKLAGGASYQRTFKWNQKFGVPPTLVARGVYTLRAKFSGVLGNVTAEVSLVSAKTG